MISNIIVPFGGRFFFLRRLWGVVVLVFPQSAVTEWPPPLTQRHLPLPWMIGIQMMQYGCCDKCSLELIECLLHCLLPSEFLWAFLRRVVNGEEIELKPPIEIYRNLWIPNPKNPASPLPYGEQTVTTSTLASFIWVPSWLIMYPGKGMEGTWNWHFFFMMYSCSYKRCGRTLLTWSAWLSKEEE